MSARYYVLLRVFTYLHVEHKGREQGCRERHLQGKVPRTDTILMDALHGVARDYPRANEAHGFRNAGK